MASLRRLGLPLLFLSFCQASAEEIIGADGKEYHPKRHNHHQKHQKTSVHPDAKASLPIAHAGTVRFSLDTPTVHHHGASYHGGVISSDPALQHVTAPAEHHGNLHHLRKHHKEHLLNEHHKVHMLNHKAPEAKGDEKKEGDAAEKEKQKEEKKSSKKKKADDEEESGDDDKKEETKEEKKSSKKKKAEDEDESGDDDKKEETKDKKKAKEDSDEADEDTDEAGGSPAKWSNGKKGGPLPVQGYNEYHDGKKVEHEDMKTLTSDWQEEFGPKMKGMDSYKDICAKYPDNEWCRLHKAARPAASWEPWRAHARRSGPILVSALLAVFVASAQ